MNFFAAQDRAKRATRWLVIVYIVATVLIVAGVTAIAGFAMYQGGAAVSPNALFAVAVLATLFIVGATLYKTSVLSSGGGRVARDMGGTLVATDVQDPLRRRLRNVVEEMAIASGIPVPEIYILESETGINAFAAGFTTGDAAIAVTRGALEVLSRDELQGVIAHEFSHIMNGDMRLSIRMMGVLFGIMVLGIIGRMVLRGSYHGSLVSNRRNRNAPAVMMIGLGLAILGWIGVFFARLIKAAVSRQRETLADAAAVQFTRQTDGLANALKKIGGYDQKSYITSVDSEEVSHMLFADGVPKIASLFATHPPIGDRIRALDPSFRETDYPRIAPHAFTDHAEGAPAAFAAAPAMPNAGHARIDGNIANSIGKPTAAHVSYAGELRRSIPELLYNAAHSPEGALLLTLALVLNTTDQERQLRLIEDKLGAARVALVRRYVDALHDIGPLYRMPLLEIAFPELKQRPTPRLEFLLDLVQQLIELDGTIDLREYCYYRIISRHLETAVAPSIDGSENRVGKSDARAAAVMLLRIVADYGSNDVTESAAAFNAGIAVFGAWAGDDMPMYEGSETVAKLDQALDALSRINTAGRQSLIEAVTKTVSHDGKLTATEAELLRAICASLDCPLPPILATP